MEPELWKEFQLKKKISGSQFLMEASNKILAVKIFEQLERRMPSVWIWIEIVLISQY